jgi:hypothetical protein
MHNFSPPPPRTEMAKLSDRYGWMSQKGNNSHHSNGLLNMNMLSYKILIYHYYSLQKAAMLNNGTKNAFFRQHQFMDNYMVCNSCKKMRLLANKTGSANVQKVENSFTES